MAAPVALLAKAATLALTDEKTRKGIGWCIVAILSPIIVLFALLCSVAAGTAEHNVSAAEFCFSDVALPADLPEEYKASIENMRAHFAELDALLADIGDHTEGDETLDAIRVKAIFYALFFGAEEPAPFDADVYQKFVDCFATFEETTWTITGTDDDGNEVEPGTPGEELSRGPSVFVGYLKAREITDGVLDDDGWFHSGDLCVMDEAGNIHIIGRKKDMIVRGGENLNSNEINDML